MAEWDPESGIMMLGQIRTIQYGPRKQYWMLAVPAAALIAMAVILFTHKRPPLFADYPEWTYQGALLRNMIQGHPDSAYLLKNYPVPNSLTTLGLAGLMAIMPWSAAAKVWLLAEVALGIWSARRLQRAGGGRQSWQLIVLTAGSVLGINLWYGFTNFQFATFFAMLFSALLIEQFESEWIYGALLILVFVSHMIPFGFALCILFLYARQNRRWQMLWQTLPSLFLTAWYFLGRITHANVDSRAGMHSSVRYASWAFVAFRINTCLKCWGLVNAVSSFHYSVLVKLIGEKLFLLFFCLDAIIAAVVLALAAMAARKSVLNRDSIRFFWHGVILFFLVGLFMPGTAAGISDPGARMVQLSMWCAVCVVVANRRWIRAALSGCAVALMALSFYQMVVVAERPPVAGTTGGSLPRVLQNFDHVEYSAHSSYYDKIGQGKMDAPIFPTAMFTEDPGRRSR